MNKAYKNLPVAASLRQKVEETLRKKHFENSTQLSESATLKHIHELEVQNVALKEQHNELQQVLDEATKTAEKFTALYDFAPVGYFTIKQDGTICELNYSGAKMLGLERSCLVNHSFGSFVSEETLPVFNEFMNKVFESNFKYTCDVMLKSKEVTSIFIHIEGILSNDDQKCLITAVDITSLKLVEEALREREYFFKQSQRAAFIGSYKFDFATGFWNSSEVLDQIFGIDKSYSRSIQGWLDIAHPEDREMMDRYFSEEVISKRNPFNKEYRIIRKSDGEIRWVMGLGQLFIDAHDNVISMYGTIQDITERKRVEEALRLSETKFRKLHESLMDGVAQVDMNGVIRECNEPFLKMLGYNFQELINLSYNDITPKKWHTFEKKILEEHILVKGYSKIYEKEYIKKGGTVFPVELRTFLIKNDAGEIIGMWAIVRDITKRKQTEEKLVRLNQQLKEINAAKDKFFSIIAHDLKNPFNAIMGFSNIIAEQISVKDYEGLKEYALIIQNSSRHAMALLANLYQWSRSQTGRMEFTPENFEIVELIDEVIDLSNDSACQKSITISRELPDNATVFADKAMISTILRNLISNAIKFTNPGGQIVISTEQRRNKLIVSICDNGVGISEEGIKKLFRIDETYSTKGTLKETGTGLGLLLCKEFILKHGGEIWVESERDKGSMFKFAIPINSEK